MKQKLIKIALAELVFDYDLYPRSEIDTQHVSYLGEAMDAGAEFPPIVGCAKTKRISDGFHRATLYKKRMKPDDKIEFVAKQYANDAELFADAIRYNSGHGRRLTTHDKTRCLILAEKIGLRVEDVASALSLTVDAVGKLRADRVGELRVSPTHTEALPLKRTIRHMQGTPLTPAQAKANEHLSGMQQLFYVNQIIMILENDLLEPDNEELNERLIALSSLIDSKVATTA